MKASDFPVPDSGVIAKPNDYHLFSDGYYVTLFTREMLGSGDAEGADKYLTDVEACEKLVCDRHIHMDMQNTCAQLLLMVKNSVNDIILQEDGASTGDSRSVSGKTDGGFRLRSGEVVSRNSGVLTLEWDADTFTAYAAVPL